MTARRWACWLVVSLPIAIALVLVLASAGRRSGAFLLWALLVGG